MFGEEIIYLILTGKLGNFIIEENKLNIYPYRMEYNLKKINKILIFKKKILNHFNFLAISIFVKVNDRSKHEFRF